MKKLYLKIALKNLFRNKLYTVINIIGFSFGIGIILYLFLYLKFETTYENFVKDKDNIYRILTKWTINGESSIEGTARYPVAREAKNRLVGIEDFCRISSAKNENVWIGENSFKVNRLCLVDPNFFSFTGMKLLNGDPANVLKSPQNIVITESLARKIFGNENALGKQLIVKNIPFTVTGIAATPPANTHLSFEALTTTAVLETRKNVYLQWDGGPSFLSLIKIIPSTSPNTIEKGINGLYYEEVGEKMASANASVGVLLQKFTDMHLKSNPEWSDFSTVKSFKNLGIVSSVALIILLLAVINYISLYVAQKTGKIKDAGILSVHGANKKQLFLLSFVEVISISILSTILGIVLFLIAAPFFNNFLHSQVDLLGNIWQVTGFLIILNILVSFIITIISNYKSIKLRTIDSIHEKITFKSNLALGNLQIFFQFLIITTLIIVGLFITKQYNFILNKDLGFTKEDILVVTPDVDVKPTQLQSFKQSLSSISQITGISLTSQSIGEGYLTSNGYSVEKKDPSMINVIYTDDSFLDVFKIKLNEGRNLNATDSLNILINREFTKKENWQTALGKNIYRNGKLTVVGEVENFNFATLIQPVMPLIIAKTGNEGWLSNVNIAYKTNDISGLRRAILEKWKQHFPQSTPEITFLSDQLEKNYTQLTSVQHMIGIFIIIAGIIACMGLFGLTTYYAQKRTKEVGVRKVNGAKESEIIAMMNKRFFVWISVALITAFPLAWFLSSKILENFAYKTSLSWWIFALAGIIVMSLALLTVSWQSWHAATRNPVEALRYE